MFYKPPARLLSPPWKRTFTGSPRSQERSRREQPLARHLGGLKEEKKKIKLNNKAEKDGINLRHGTWVASHPGATILASVAVCGLFSLGLLNFQQETNMVRLWLPQVAGKFAKYLGNKVHRSQTSCSTWPGCGRGGQQTRDIGGRLEQE